MDLTTLQTTVFALDFTTLSDADQQTALNFLNSLLKLYVQDMITGADSSTLMTTLQTLAQARKSMQTIQQTQITL